MRELIESLGGHLDEGSKGAKARVIAAMLVAAIAAAAGERVEGARREEMVTKVAKTLTVSSAKNEEVSAHEVDLALAALKGMLRRTPTREAVLRELRK